MDSETPLAQVVDSFFISNSMKDNTHDYYKQNFGAFTGFIEKQFDRPAILADLCYDYVNPYIRALEKMPTAKYPKGSPFRARGAATALKRLSNWVYQEGILPEPPLKRLKKPKELKDVRQPLSDEELEAVIYFSGKPGDRDHALVIFAAGTGMRLNELRELRISDLHLRDCEVNVRPETCKVGVGRTVVFHEDVAKVLDKYLRTRSGLQPESPVFPTDEGTFFKENSLGKLFERLGEKAGVPRLHAHLLRHTWATNFMRDGGDLLQLKRQGGWRRWEMVERYSHVVPIKDRKTLPNPAATRLIAFKRRAS